MSRTTYPAATWFDPRIELGTSPIDGKGLFATDAIQAGEIVMIWGGIVFTSEDWRTGRVRLDPHAYTESRIDDDLCIAAPMEGLDHYFNHACDPTTWMQDNITVIARRDIQPGEEITIDYATLESDERYAIDPCRCRTPLCRGRVTGNDWRLPELQQRYRGHFMPFIQHWIQQ